MRAVVVTCRYYVPERAQVGELEHPLAPGGGLFSVKKGDSMTELYAHVLLKMKHSHPYVPDLHHRHKH